jgi:predicted nucleic acid-binding protein
MIVLDASVAVKAYLTEDGTEEATALMVEKTQLFAPELIRVEVTAALCRRVRLGQLDPVDAQVRIDHWLARLGEGLLSLTPDHEAIAEAAALAIALRHPVQDCLYLAVARLRGTSMITADRTFFERATPRFPEVTLLPGLPAH